MDLLPEHMPELVTTSSELFLRMQILGPIIEVRRPPPGVFEKNEVVLNARKAKKQAEQQQKEVEKKAAADVAFLKLSEEEKKSRLYSAAKPAMPTIRRDFGLIDVDYDHMTKPIWEPFDDVQGVGTDGIYILNILIY